jgi:hypothetical protein
VIDEPLERVLKYNLYKLRGIHGKGGYCPNHWDSGMLRSKLANFDFILPLSLTEFSG